MDDKLILKNRLKDARTERGLSQSALAELVGVSRNTITSIEPHRQAGPGAVYRFGQKI